MSNTECLIVGAGLAGLLAAHTLQEAGVHVTVLERAAVAGGRMATQRLVLGAQQVALFDHGAQYFTVRSQRFRPWVERWLAAGVVQQWSNGFATPDGSVYRDGHPRYRGSPNMAAVPGHLAQALPVRLNTPVRAVAYDGGWVVHAGDETFTAGALLFTPPVPQTLALLDAGTLSLPDDLRQALARIDYDPCLAVLAVLDGPSNVPPPGGLWLGAGPISWLADNQQKGISPLPAVTIHGSPEFSNAHFDDDVDVVAALLLQAARPWLGAGVLTHRVRRWRYSIPVHVHPQPCLIGNAPGLVAFAGDAFAGPRVEGAALSGLAAAAALRSHLR